VSATPKAPLWIGFFSKSGSPALKIKLSGPFGDGLEFEGILDTGFTGFISMPLLSALPLGLILYGTASVELADGSKQVKLTAQAMAKVEGESEVGVVILEPSSNDVLIGMAFLRLFRRAVLLSSNSVVLVDETFKPEGAAQEESAPEPGSPDTPEISN
jgi:predicted aspartyl protease